MVVLGGGVGSGCGDTIDVGLPGSVPPRVTGASDAGPSAPVGIGSDAMMGPDLGGVESTAQPLSDCLTSTTAGIGGAPTQPGPSMTVNCSVASSVQCWGMGRGVRATIAPLDCDPVAGLSGDPAQVHTLCDAALDGRSGESCEGPFSCGRVLDNESCCVQIALCKPGSRQLRRYRACPSVCPGPSPASGGTVLVSSGGGVLASCSDVAALWQLDASIGAWVGTRCMGHFVCSSVRSLAPRDDGATMDQHLYYCANGALQLLPLLLHLL